MSSKPYNAWYSSKKWFNLRNNHLRGNLLCIKCEQFDIVTIATVVDHIIPHKGDWNIFIDRDNLASLCTSCHNHKTQYETRCIKEGKDPSFFYHEDY